MPTVRRIVPFNARIYLLILLFETVLITGQLSKDIREVGKEIETLFGILNEDLLKLQ